MLEKYYVHKSSYNNLKKELYRLAKKFYVLSGGVVQYEIRDETIVRVPPKKRYGATIITIQSSEKKYPKSLESIIKNYKKVKFNLAPI